MAKVSIVVPVYKVEKYIDNCIESLASQSLKDIEIILVDDGSPDKCGEICDQYAAKDNRIKVLHKKNAGVSAARNDGLLQASGEYVLFCDSDDWMEEDACEKLYCAAKNNNADIAIGDVFMAYDSGERKAVRFYENEFCIEQRDRIDEMICADIYRTYCTNPPKEGVAFGYGGPWNKLVRRELILDNGINFDLRVKGVFDDILYTAHILFHAKKICYIHENVYNYRIIASSITHSYKPNVVEINDAIFSCWNEFFEKTGNKNKYEKPFYACVMRRLEEAIKLYFVNEKNEKTLSERMGELTKVVKSEPYKTAAQCVDLKKISKKQRMLAIMIRHHSIFMVMFIRKFR